MLNYIGSSGLRIYCLVCVFLYYFIFSKEMGSWRWCIREEESVEFGESRVF